MMKRNLKKWNRHEQGQGLVEYALILVLVAIVVIAALMMLGPAVGDVFSKVTFRLRAATAGYTANTLVVNSVSVSKVVPTGGGGGMYSNVKVNFNVPNCSNGIGDPVASCTVSVKCTISPGGTTVTGSVSTSDPGSCNFGSAMPGNQIAIQVTGATSSGLTWSGSSPTATTVTVP